MDDGAPDTLAVHSGSIKLGYVAFGLTEIISAGGSSSNLQSGREKKESEE